MKIVMTACAHYRESRKEQGNPPFLLCKNLNPITIDIMQQSNPSLRKVPLLFTHTDKTHGLQLYFLTRFDLQEDI